MTNAESLKAIVTALGGTPSDTTNAALIQEISVLLGSEASASSNSGALANLAAAATGKVFGMGQTKTAAPATSKVTVEPDAGKVLTKVEVSAVTADIDANIIPGNVKKDITILGVTGTYEGSGGSSAWALWDGTTTIADADGNALYDVYFVLPVAGSSPAATVSGMVPKGGALTESSDIMLSASEVTEDGVNASRAFVGSSNYGYSMTIPLSGDPPIAGAVTGTEFTPAVGTNVLVYIRDSAGLPNA